MSLVSSELSMRRFNKSNALDGQHRRIFFQIFSVFLCFSLISIWEVHLPERTETGPITGRTRLCRRCIAGFTHETVGTNTHMLFCTTFLPFLRDQSRF